MISYYLFIFCLGSGPLSRCDDSETLTDFNNCLVQTFNEQLKPLVISGMSFMSLSKNTIV